MTDALDRNPPDPTFSNVNPTLITRLMGKEDAPPASAAVQRFDLFIGIDYSGAGRPEEPLKGLQVYSARPAQPVEKQAAPVRGKSKTSNWSRQGIAHMLLERARAGERFIAGIDHCFSMPSTYFNRYGLKNWPEFLDDFVAHWPAHEAGRTVESLLPDSKRSGGSSEFRLAEKWTSSAKSVFLFGVQGAVAKSSHAGIPWLKWLRDQAGDRLHFWPFDGWDPAPGKSVIAEVYPSMLRRRYDRPAGMNADQYDAYAVAMWLMRTAGRGALGEYLRMPPLSSEEQAAVAREGWVLGVR